MLIMNKWKLNWANCGCVVILAALTIGVLVVVVPPLLITIAALVFGIGIEAGYPEPEYDISDAARFGNENLIRSYGADFTPQWSSDGRIITTGIRRGIKGVTADGSELWDIPTPKPEHHTYGVAISPSLSATGRVAYLIYPDLDNEERAIETAAADGSDFEKFSDISAEVNNPVWSPDGSRLAFTTQIEVTLINSFGVEEDILVDTVVTAASDGSSIIQFPIVEEWSAKHPVWSNDGQRLVYVASTLIHDDHTDENVVLYRVVNARWDNTDEKIVMEHRVPNRIHLPPSFEPKSLAWSTTDDRIYFVHYELLGGEDIGNVPRFAPSVRSVRPDGSDERIIALWWEHFRVKGLKVSPDGSQLLFTSYHSPTEKNHIWAHTRRMLEGKNKTDVDLYVMKTDDGEVRKVFDPIDDSLYRSIYASWSPDGSRIAVHYLGNGGSVFTISPDGSDARMLIKPNIDGLLVPGLGEPLPEELLDPAP